MQKEMNFDFFKEKIQPTFYEKSLKIFNVIWMGLVAIHFLMSLFPSSGSDEVVQKIIHSANTVQSMEVVSFKNNKEISAIMVEKKDDKIILNTDAIFFDNHNKREIIQSLDKSEYKVIDFTTKRSLIKDELPQYQIIMKKK